MRIYNTTPLSPDAAAPFSSGTMDFIFDSHKDTTAETIKAAIGIGYNPNTPYILNGAYLIETSPDHFTTATGSIFYQGELFQVDAKGVTLYDLGTSLTMSISNYTTNADPVTLTDLSVVYVHNIRKMEWVNADAGSYSLPFPDRYFNADPTHIKYGTIFQEDCLHKTTSMDSAHITFTHDANYSWDTTSATNNTITLDITGAIQGTRIRITQTGTPGAGISYVTTGGASFVSPGLSSFNSYGNYISEIVYNGAGSINDFTIMDMTQFTTKWVSVAPYCISPWGTSDASFIVDLTGTLKFKGRFKSTGTPGSATLGTMPAGFRTGLSHSYFACQADVGGVASIAQVIIGSDGSMIIEDPVFTNLVSGSYISADQIYYTSA